MKQTKAAAAMLRRHAARLHSRATYTMLAITAGIVAPIAANAQTGGTAPTGNPVDVSGYAQTFADAKASLLAVITGPGTDAFGIMLVGLIFAVVWSLYKKGVKSFGH